MLNQLIRLFVWSRAAQGPGERRRDTLDRMAVGMALVIASDGDPEDWAELVLLAQDGLTRSLWARDLWAPAEAIAEAAVEVINRTQGQNERDSDQGFARRADGSGSVRAADADGAAL